MTNRKNDTYKKKIRIGWEEKRKPTIERNESGVNEKMKDIESHQNLQESRLIFQKVNEKRAVFKPRVTNCKEEDWNLLTEKNEILVSWKSILQDQQSGRSSRRYDGGTSCQRSPKSFITTKRWESSITWRKTSGQLWFSSWQGNLLYPRLWVHSPTNGHGIFWRELKNS